MRARAIGDGNHALVEDGHVLHQAADIGAFFHGDLVLDPVGERDVAEVHALLQHQALAVLHQHAVFARVVALLHAQFVQEVLQRLAFGHRFRGAQRGIERCPQRRFLRIQRPPRFRQAFALLRQRDFHARLHDEPGQQTGSDGRKTGQQYPDQSFHAVNANLISDSKH